MTNDTPEPDIAKIRELLLAAFTPEDLRRFCYDRPTFRPVVNRFGRPYRLDDMADELITYCETYLLFPELLAELKQHNPRQYARFLEPELPEEKPPPPTPKVLTIASPIKLDLVRIPAGEFLMGSIAAKDECAEDDELPPHRVYLPEFYIGKYPVTNLQYQAFVSATGHPAESRAEGGAMPLWGPSNHPVAWISWPDALAFCNWLSQETGQPFRLPTEAEWEKAARGTDGRIYPWGDEPPDEGWCNLGGWVGQTTAIGRYSTQGDSPYGCADMSGNVWEWCQSLYRPYPYQAHDGREDLASEDFRVLRGGSFHDEPGNVRCASRNNYGPFYWLNYVGFRVATGPPG